MESHSRGGAHIFEEKFVRRARRGELAALPDHRRATKLDEKATKTWRAAKKTGILPVASLVGEESVRQCEEDECV